MLLFSGSHYVVIPSGARNLGVIDAVRFKISRYALNDRLLRRIWSRRTTRRFVIDLGSGEYLLYAEDGELLDAVYLSDE